MFALDQDDTPEPAAPLHIKRVDSARTKRRKHVVRSFKQGVRRFRNGKHGAVVLVLAVDNETGKALVQRGKGHTTLTVALCDLYPILL
jgi:hypothetical protein